nr:hypothetical protein HK105_003756 [Polyrhizophydium stewartii]
MLSSVATNRVEATALHLVRGFLADNNLHETLAALEREAAEPLADIADLVPLTSRPLVGVIEELQDLTLHSSLKQLAIQDALDSGLVPAPGAAPLATSSDAARVFHGIHHANILCVAPTTLPAAVFPEHALPDDYVRVLLTGSADKSLRISDAASGQLLATLGHPASPVLAVAVHPSIPTIAATACMDGSVHLVDLAARTVLADWARSHAKYVTQCAFSPCGSWLVTGSHDRSVNIYRLASAPGGPHPPSYTKRHTTTFKGAVESMCILRAGSASTPSPTLVVGVREDNNLHYIDLDDAESLQATPVNLNANGDAWVSFTPVHMAPSPSGAHLAVYTDAKSGRIIVFQTRTSRIVRDLWGVEADGFTQASCCWHPSGNYLFASSDNRSILVFHAASGRIVDKLVGHEGLVRHIVFDGEQSALVSVSYDRTVRVWPIGGASRPALVRSNDSMEL